MSRDDRNDVRLRTSKALGYILSHGAPAVGLALDDEGFATVDDVLQALRVLGRVHASLDEQTLLATVDAPGVSRYERVGDRLRLRAGRVLPPPALRVEPVRTTPARQEAPSAPRAQQPPGELFHGTGQRAAEAIMTGAGLLAKGRQTVHLSTDIDDAARSAARHGPDFVVLRVDAVAAAAAGTAFTRAGGRTWTASAVAVEFITRVEPSMIRDRLAHTGPAPAQPEARAVQSHNTASPTPTAPPRGRPGPVATGSTRVQPTAPPRGGPGATAPDRPPSHPSTGAPATRRRRPRSS